MASLALVAFLQPHRSSSASSVLPESWPTLLAGLRVQGEKSYCLSNTGISVGKEALLWPFEGGLAAATVYPAWVVTMATVQCAGQCSCVVSVPLPMAHGFPDQRCQACLTIQDPRASPRGAATLLGAVAWQRYGGC